MHGFSLVVPLPYNNLSGGLSVSFPNRQTSSFFWGASAHIIHNSPISSFRLSLAGVLPSGAKVQIFHKTIPPVDFSHKLFFPKSHFWLCLLPLRPKKSIRENRCRNYRCISHIPSLHTIHIHPYAPFSYRKILLEEEKKAMKVSLFIYYK